MILKSKKYYLIQFQFWANGDMKVGASITQLAGC